MGVLAQRLVRVICPKCKEKYAPGAGVLKDLELTKKTVFYRGKGCDKCKRAGFLGRIGIFELLILSEDTKKMVAAKTSSDEIRKKAISEGMISLFSDGISKVKDGITTIEEVLRATKVEGE